MNFPPFWAKGEYDGFMCWRWSHRSLDEALTLAEQAARKLADRFRAGDIPKHGYGYPDRPFREPVLCELKNNAGEVAAVVTRNSYGSLVLNTARVMFVDVDLPEPKPAGGLLKRLFGKPDLKPAADPAKDAIAKAEMWSRNNPGWGWRIYRTRGGLRLLATHALFEPETAASGGVFDALGADTLYRQLCKTQKCFRARLTPKPWRCGAEKPPTRWPFSDAKAEARFNKWESAYQNTCRDWATCELIQTIGNRDVHSDVRLVVELHDETTRAEAKLKLA